MVDGELVIRAETFDDFLREVKARGIRSVRLADYGFVEPERAAAGAIVMMPKVRLVATAIDKREKKLIRWQQTKRANQTVTIHVGTDEGTHGEARVRAQRQDLRERLEFEDVVVQSGEWKPEAVRRLLGGVG